jgi:hypothetical protein
MNYPSDMDTECILICNAMNALAGITTMESCCGHGDRPFRIYFVAEEIKSLAPIAGNCLSSAWHLEVRWANGSSSVYFVLEGPVGPPDISGGANDFAAWLSHC